MMLEVADLQLDRLKRKVTRSGKKINLQPREFRLLEYLMSNAGQVVTRTMLLEKCGNTTLTRRPTSLTSTSRACAAKSTKTSTHL